MPFSVNVGGLLFHQRGAVNLSFEAQPTWFGDDSETLALIGGLGGPRIPAPPGARPGRMTR